MSLEHPNVVPIHDAGDVDGRLYLAMRLVEGTDLKALLQARGCARPGPRRSPSAARSRSALDAAHARGLVHRDVKPSNVLLDANEHVYLADFGLTRRLDEQGGPAGEGRSMGTPAYLAPEQIEGGSVDGRADVYSLGCLLYECLTGETPFARGSRLAVAWAHLEEEPPSASERRPELPEAIDAVIRKAMAKEPDDRYTTCAALITAAEEALGLRRPPTPAPARSSSAHRRGLPSLLVLAARSSAARGHSRHRRRRRVRAGRRGRHARPHRPCDEHGQCGRSTSVGVPPRPLSAGAASGSTTMHGPSVSEIDAATETSDTQRPACPRHPPTVSAFTGPVLAADAGRRLVRRRRSREEGPSSHADVLGRRKARLPARAASPVRSRSATAPSGSSLRGARDNQVLRIDPATGEVTERTHFPTSSPIDGLAVGLGGVWVVASSTAMLYRINPRSAAVTGRSSTSETRAARP